MLDMSAPSQRMVKDNSQILDRGSNENSLEHKNTISLYKGRLVNLFSPVLVKPVHALPCCVWCTLPQIQTDPSRFATGRGALLSAVFVCFVFYQTINQELIQTCVQMSIIPDMHTPFILNN